MILKEKKKLLSGAKRLQRIVFSVLHQNEQIIMGLSINQTVQLTYTKEFDDWLHSTFKVADSFKHRIKMMIATKKIPPASSKSDKPLSSTCVKIDFDLAKLLNPYSGDSWNAKFHDFANITTTNTSGRNGSQRAYYTSDESHKRIKGLGNGNASQGLRVLTSDRTVTLSESQRDALMLLGEGSIEEGLKTLIGP